MQSTRNYTEWIFVAVSAVVSVVCLSVVGGGGLRPWMQMLIAYQHYIAQLLSHPMPGDIKCDGCETQSSSLFCEQCSAYYCSACDATAHAVKNARSHVRVSSNAMAHGRVHFCSSHAGKRADLFCNDCSELICLLCRDYGKHTSHSVDLIENTSQSLRDTLVRQVQSVKALTASAKETLAKVDATLEELGSGGSCDVAKASIDRHFDEVVRVLQLRRDELLLEVDQLVSAKQSQLREQAKAVKESVASGSTMLDAVRAACQLDDFSVCDGYADTITVLANIKKAASGAIIPAADAQIPMSFDDLFLDTIRNHAAVGGPMRVRFSSPANGVSVVEWDEPLRSEDRSWASYVVKCRMLSQSTDFDNNCSSWSRVGAAMEKTLATVSAPTQSLTVVLSEYPGATMEFMVMGIDSGGKSSAWAVSPQKLRLPVAFSHKSFELTGDPFSSKRGLLYYLGTRCGTSSYVNPHVAGDVAVAWSSIGGGNVDQFVDNEVGTDFCYTDDIYNSWMCVDIGEGRLFRATAYGLRHDTQGPRGVLRNWIFQGKAQEQDEWATLSNHIEDKSLRCSAGSVASFFINSPGLEGFRYFRILQNGKNSSDKHRLLCSGIELFGTLY